MKLPSRPAFAKATADKGVDTMSKYTHVAVLYAPGTNCHEETMHALTEILEIKSTLVIIDEKGKLSHSLKNFTGLTLPGGFSYGDHFGAGRVLSVLIRYSRYKEQRLIDELREFAARKKQILGICNGFQVLTETGLLPGALLKNASGHFDSPSSWVDIRAAQYDFWRTNHLRYKTLHLPAAYGEGRFVWKADTDDGLVFPAFYYVDDAGTPTIAGITDKSGYIMGMMPHPERAALPHHKSQDGLEILKIFKE